MECIEAVNLSSWKVIKISGNDTVDYLNGIITLELLSLSENQTRRSAFLTPRGKIKSIFWVRKNSDSFTFFCPPEMQTELIEDLLKYKLSMMVTLEDLSNEIEGLYLKKIDSEGTEGLSSENCNYQIIIEKIPETTQSYQNYKEQMVLRQLPQPESYVGEIPWEIGLADLINLDKGCFLGQEPISRMINRGRLRKYLYFGKISDSDSNALTFNDKEVGTIITKVDQEQTTYAMFFLT